MFKNAIFITIILGLLMLLCSCNSTEEVYSTIKIGEDFGTNIDGYQKKLPCDFCLDVILDSKTRLFKVPDDCLDVPYFANSVYNTPAIIEGRFIKGYYNSEYLIMCEQIALDDFEYVVFDFETQEINRFTNENKLPEYESINWFSLCNTMQQSVP